MGDDTLGLYVIIGRDGPDAKEKRPVIRTEHLAHLRKTVDAGRMVLAGPLTDGAGSLIVLKAESLEAAQALADADPYVRGGVFAEVEVHPFKHVLP